MSANKNEKVRIRHWIVALGSTCVAAAVQATPSFLLSGQPVPGGSFSLVWVDDAVDRSSGLTDFDLEVGWDPSALQLTGVSAGSLFGTAEVQQTFSVDINGDGSVINPGFTFTRTDPAYDAAAVVRNDVAYLHFDVIGLAVGQTSNVEFYPWPLPGGPYQGYYYFSPGGPQSFEGIAVQIGVVPEPASIALIMTGLLVVGVAVQRRASR